MIIIGMTIMIAILTSEESQNHVLYLEGLAVSAYANVCIAILTIVIILGI